MITTPQTHTDFEGDKINTLPEGFTEADFSRGPDIHKFTIPNDPNYSPMDLSTLLTYKDDPNFDYFVAAIKASYDRDLKIIPVDKSFKFPKLDHVGPDVYFIPEDNYKEALANYHRNKENFKNGFVSHFYFDFNTLTYVESKVEVKNTTTTFAEYYGKEEEMCENHIVLPNWKSEFTKGYVLFDASHNTVCSPIMHHPMDILKLFEDHLSSHILTVIYFKMLKIPLYISPIKDIKSLVSAIYLGGFTQILDWDISITQNYKNKIESNKVAVVIKSKYIPEVTFCVTTTNGIKVEDILMCVLYLEATREFNETYGLYMTANLTIIELLREVRSELKIAEISAMHLKTQLSD